MKELHWDTHTDQAYMKALAGLGSGLNGNSLKLDVVGPKAIGRGNRSTWHFSGIRDACDQSKQ